MNQSDNNPVSEATVATEATNRSDSELSRSVLKDMLNQALDRGGDVHLGGYSLKDQLAAQGLSRVS